MDMFLLASASPRRRQLLTSAGYRFEVKVSEIHEPDNLPFPNPASHAIFTAWLKADAIVRREAAVLPVLAADTVVYCHGQSLGKPVDRADALRILQALAGQSHEVVTGLCLVLPTLAVTLTTSATTSVIMRPITSDQIEQYLDTGLWQGKAGAYGIQDEATDPFVERIEGSLTNVIGLPMKQVSELLQHASRLLTPTT